MSFQIRLYSFSKQNTSTAIPTIDGEIHTGTLKQDSGILNPRVLISTKINLPADEDGYPFNYAYIPRFKRRYFIQELTWTSDGWLLDLRVDVLGTLKSVIGNSTQYILRSSRSNNSRVRDDTHFTIAQKTLSKSSANNPWDSIFAASDNGRYILGIIGGNTRTVGAVTYISMTKTQMTAFCSTVFNSASAYWGLSNPMDYIVSCQWSPIVPSGGSQFEEIQIGKETFRVSCNVLGAVDLYSSANVTLSVPKHPQQSTFGEWLNLPPYARYDLYFYPFGYIPLDGSKMLDVSTITCHVELDHVSGSAQLTVHNGSVTSFGSGNVLAIAHAQIQLDIYLSRDIHSLTGLLSNTFSLAESAVSGNGLGVALGGVGIADSLLPSAEKSGGATGSCYGYVNPVELYATFLHTQNGNNTHIGKPLCESHKISDVGGFIQCQNAHIQGYYTKEEIEEAVNLMNGGFVYE